MKTFKRTQIIVIIVLFTALISCKAQSQLAQINTNNTEIVGTWVSENDSTYKIEFTSNGIQKEYINNVTQQETNSYEIVSSCGANTNNDVDLYLKRYTSSSDFVCDIINNISTNQNGETILSITSERGKLELYIKQ